MTEASDRTKRIREATLDASRLRKLAGEMEISAAVQIAEAAELRVRALELVEEAKR